MIKSFQIENYRGFKSFKLSELGRINLLVGENDSGKTSILEAIYLFASYPQLHSLLDILKHRGEFFWVQGDDYGHGYPMAFGKKFEFVNVFNRDDFQEKAEIFLMGFIDEKEYEMKICLNNLFDINLEKVSQTEEELNILSKIVANAPKTDTFEQNVLSCSFRIKNTPNQQYKPIEINMRDDGLLFPFSTIKDLQSKNNIDNALNIKTKFINPFKQDINDLITIFDKIALTPSEDMVIEALKIIEPKINRIATNKSKMREKGDFKILLENHDQPISIASMGDGIWQLLRIVLAMVNTEDGVLLIDEIDTGLHFTTLEKMWKLIWEIATKLNIQVFATTHNSDCWRSLGKLIDEKQLEAENITLHRIEKDKTESILFDAEEIVIAKDNEIEVR